ncbi:uncharacterized protein TNCV_3153901 [Trichonephila clavipes]|nr:uncharacterized protein TNCV_3153901 [Trichonephila clavipes]
MQQPVCYQDLKTSAQNYIHRVWQDTWDQQVLNKLHSIHPSTSHWAALPVRRHDVRLTRLCIGHTRFTHRHLLLDSSVTLDDSPLSIPGGFKDAAVLVRDATEFILATLFPSKGVCETFRISSPQSTSSVHVESYDKINVGKEATSIALYEIGNVIYLAVSRFNDHPKTGGYSKIYNRMSDGWDRFQNIPVFASSYVKHFFYHGFHYLAFSNVAPVHETREPKSIKKRSNRPSVVKTKVTDVETALQRSSLKRQCLHKRNYRINILAESERVLGCSKRAQRVAHYGTIFRNSGSSHQWFSLFQKVPFDHSKGLEVFEFGDLSELYLATWNETRIQIYKLEGESGLKLSFTLHGKCIKDVKPLKIDGDIYLAVGQQNLKNGHVVKSVLYKGLTKGKMQQIKLFSLLNKDNLAITLGDYIDRP